MSTYTTVAVFSTNPVNDGNWHYIAATWTGTAGAVPTASQLQIYVDGQNATGVPFSSGTLTVTAPINFFSSCNATNDHGWAIGSGSVYQDFSADEVATYEYALTPAQILRHYQVGTGEATSARHRPVRRYPR
jgi:hypothetical protein